MIQSVVNAYVDAILECFEDDVVELVEALRSLVAGLKCRDNRGIAFSEYLFSPYLDSNKKFDLLLEIAQCSSNLFSSQEMDSKLTSKMQISFSLRFKNLLACLVDNRRLDIIGPLCESLEFELRKRSDEYLATLYVDGPLEVEFLEFIRDRISRHLGLNIMLTQKVWENDSIRLIIEGLGIEANFSKDQLRRDIKSHILHAI